MARAGLGPRARAPPRVKQAGSVGRSREREREREREKRVHKRVHKRMHHQLVSLPNPKEEERRRNEGVSARSKGCIPSNHPNEEEPEENRASAVDASSLKSSSRASRRETRKQPKSSPQRKVRIVSLLPLCLSVTHFSFFFSFIHSLMVYSLNIQCSQRLNYG